MIIYVPSGGISEAYSAISVTYPEGSICTCSNGTKTLRAKDTSGQWLFCLPSGGDWTVRCTDGDRSAQKVLTITAQYEIENVKLGYLVPAGYQAVEYIESTGTQYFDTGIGVGFSTRDTIEFAAEFTPTSETVSVGGVLFGVTKDTQLYLPQVYTPVRVNFFGTFVNTTAARYDRNTFTANVVNGKQIIVLNDATFKGSVSYTSTKALSGNFYLLSTNNGGVPYGHGTNFSGKTYSARLSRNGTLLRDFVPCYRKADNVAGMWEKVDEKFYTNAGTGTFIVGGDI